MIRRLVLVLLFGAVAVPGASGRSLDQTWSGVWHYGGEDYTLVQKGGTVTGTGSLTKYQLVGTVNGNALTGKIMSAPGISPPTCQYVKWVMSADGKHFVATIGSTVQGAPGTTPSCPAPANTYTNQVPYECSGGACLQNGSAAARPSVVGTWSYKGGSIKIAASGSGWIGTVAKATNEPCKRAVGQRIWELIGTGPYTGTHLALTAPGCKAAKVPATFTLARNTLTVCATAGGKKSCSKAARLKS